MDNMEQTSGGGGAGGSTKWIVGIVVLVLVIWGLVAANKNKNQGGSENMTKSEETGPVKIGFIGPLTGDQANIGQNAKAALEIAVDEINNSDGVNGRKLEVVYEDGKCTGKDAINAANKLIDVDKVVAILGGACSGETLGFAAKAEASKIPVISYCSSNPSITTAGDYIFRVYPSDSFQGKFGAEKVYNELKKTKVAILYAKNDWATGITAVFKKAFIDLGGQIVAEESVDPATRDFRTVLNKIKLANPELIYFVSYTENAIPGLKQKSELGFNIPVLGADAWDDAKIWSELGKAGEGAMFTVAASAENQSFKDKMKAKLGNDTIIICSPGAYDAVKILSNVMKSVGTDATTIKDALYKVKYNGGALSDEISFDNNGDPVEANYIVKSVKNGKAE